MRVHDIRNAQLRAKAVRVVCEAVQVILCEQACVVRLFCFFFFSSRRRHTRFDCDWSSDVCSSDLGDTPYSMNMRKGFWYITQITVLCANGGRVHAANAEGQRKASSAPPRPRVNRLDRKSVV